MTTNSTAYGVHLPAVPEWLNKGDNAWQLAASTFVGIQSMPGLVVLYGSIVKKKWAVNSAFMALYAFAATYIVWIVVGFRMAFGDQLLPFWGKAGPAAGSSFLTQRAAKCDTESHVHHDGEVHHASDHVSDPYFPMATLVHFEFMYAAITLILLGGSVLGRMNIKAWMAFVPLWLLFSYTVGAFSLWGDGFLHRWGVIDYSGGYVIHVSSGTAGFVAAYWVDDTLAVFHTHAVAGILGGLLVGLLAEPTLSNMALHTKKTKGLFYGGGAMVMVKQIVGALFVIGWNIVSTTIILFAIKYFTPLRMSDEELLIGDDAAHGEEAYALWGDGDKYDATRQATIHTDDYMNGGRPIANAARGVTVQV